LSFNVILPIIRIISELSVILVLIAILIYYTFEITIIIAPLFFLIVFLYFYLIKGKIHFWGIKREEIDGYRIKQLKETFDAIKEIKISKLENHFIEKFTNYNYDLAKYHKLQNTFLDFPKIFLEFISILFFTTFIFFSLYKTGVDSNAIVLIGLTVGIFLKILPGVNKIIIGFQLVRFGSPVINRIYTGIFSNKEEDNFDNSSRVKINKDFKKITIKNLNYKFENQKNYLLKNINMELNAKDIVGICGESGSGKSTFLNILLGLINHSEGDINVDKKKITNFYKQYQGKIFYLPQNIFIFEDTIERNITLLGSFTKQNTNFKKFNQVLNKSDLSELVSKMPKKEKTIIGEAGKNISGGQRQKIGIARALYADPQILILDEFTNALDKLTQLKIIKNLQNFKNIKLIILVSHDLSVFEICNRKFKLNNQKLLEIK
jgi:ABC-type bacteriocin/lantibiotic exporter with double-glycine peptidase domain